MRWTAAALVAATLFAPTEARAWGWTQPRGAHYLRTWVRGLFGSRAYLANGSVQPLGASFTDIALHAYLEYGITDEWTFIASGRPLGWSQLGDRAAVYTGDYTVGVRRAIVRGTWNLAAEARYSYVPPVGDASLGGGVIGGAPWEYRPTVETHGFHGELQLGRGLGRIGWITAFAGAKYLTGASLHPVFQAGIQGGARFDFGLMVAVSVLTNVPFQSFPESNVTGAGNTRYVGWGVDLSYRFTPRWSISAGVGGAIVADANLGALPILLGFEHRAP